MITLRGAALLLLATIGSGRAESILPTADGTTWEYQLREQPPNPDGTAPVTVRISGSEELGAKTLLKFETRTGGELAKTELNEVNDTGVHCYRRNTAGGKSVLFNPPQTLIAAPLQVGAKWELDDRAAGSDMHQQFKVEAQENVTVPAGTYHAYRLHCEQPWPLSIALDRWVAPGVGVVKDVTTTRGPGGRLLSRVTSELKSLGMTAAPTPAPPSSPAPTASVTIASSAPDTAAPPEPSPAATPPGRPVAPQIAVEVTAERDGEARTEFRSDIPNLFVRWAGRDLPIDTVVRIDWVAEDVGDIAPHDFVIDDTEATVRQPDYSARFTLSRPQDGWAEGKYRVDVYLNDQRVKSVAVTIHD